MKWFGFFQYSYSQFHLLKRLWLSNPYIPFFVLKWALSNIINNTIVKVKINLLLRLARRGGAEVAGWTLDRKIQVRFPAYPHRVWALWWQGGKRRLRTSRCPCRGRLGTLKTPSCPWRGCPAAGQNLETGHLSRQYIAEISLNVTLNHNQKTLLRLRIFGLIEVATIKVKRIHRMRNIYSLHFIWIPPSTQKLYHRLIKVIIVGITMYQLSLLHIGHYWNALNQTKNKKAFTKITWRREEVYHCHNTGRGLSNTYIVGRLAVFVLQIYTERQFKNQTKNISLLLRHKQYNNAWPFMDPLRWDKVTTRIDVENA